MNKKLFCSALSPQPSALPSQAVLTCCLTRRCTDGCCLIVAGDDDGQLFGAKVFADGCVHFGARDGCDELRITINVVCAELVKSRVPECCCKSRIGCERHLERADGGLFF